MPSEPSLPAASMLAATDSPHELPLRIPLSLELDTAGLLRPRLQVGYCWQNNRLSPPFQNAQQLHKRPQVAPGHPKQTVLKTAAVPAALGSGVFEEVPSRFTRTLGLAQTSRTQAHTRTQSDALAVRINWLAGWDYQMAAIESLPGPPSVDTAGCNGAKLACDRERWLAFRHHRSVLPTVLRFRERGAIYGVILAAA